MKLVKETMCDSCGTWTGMDTGCCGRCAEDYNDRNQEAGLRRLNGRRQANGKPELVRTAEGALVEKEATT